MNLSSKSGWLQGCATITRLSEDGQILAQVESRNLIPNKSLRDFLGGGQIWGGLRVFISNSTAIPAKSNSTVTGILGTGFLVGQGNPTIVRFTATSPTYYEYHSRFTFIGEPRAFSTVGLHYPQGLSYPAFGNISSALPTGDFRYYEPLTDSNVRAYLRLDQEVIQGESEYIDVVYRVMWVNDLPGAELIGGGEPLYEFAEFGIAHFTRGLRWDRMGVSPLRKLADPKKFHRLYIGPEDQLGGNPTGTLYGPLYKQKRIRSLALNHDIGKVLNAVLHGEGYYSTCMGQGAFPGGPSQPVYNLGPTAPSPFFDPLYVGSSTGKVEASPTWATTTFWPDQYRVRIVSGGGLGTSTYYLEHRKFLRLDPTSWKEMGIPNLYRHWHAPEDFPPFPGAHGWRQTDHNIIRASATAIVQWDLTGITWLDLFTGEYKSWDGVTPAGVDYGTLPVTNISQVALDGPLAYIGCRETGLWRVNLANVGAVTQLSSHPCHGVDVDSSGRVWALVVAGTQIAIIDSTNYGNLRPFTSSRMPSPGLVGAVAGLRVNRANLSGEMAIHFHDPAPNSTNRSRLLWWSPSSPSGATTDGPFWDTSSQDIWRLKAHPNLGCWIVGTDRTYRRANYGQGSWAWERFYYQGQTWVNFDEDGNLITWAQPGFYDSTRPMKITPDGVVSFEAATGPYTESNGATTHLVNGVFINGDKLTVMGEAFTPYGWNGSSWVRGSTTARATHSGYINLPLGGAIRFTTGTFTAGDRFLVRYCEGLLKDNSVTAQLTHTFYAKNVQSGASFGALTVPGAAPYVLNIPARVNDPNWLTFDYSDLDTTEIILGGNRIPTNLIRVDGGLPPIGGVSIDPDDGVMTFNAANAGQSVTGTYTYIRE